MFKGAGRGLEAGGERAKQGGEGCLQWNEVHKGGG